jgi:bacterioferritin
MKKNDKLIASLNALLVAKLIAINQFMVDSEMCDNSGYTKLHKVLQKLANDQMLLAEWLIDRISFLDGSNTLSRLSARMIGKTVSEMMKNSNLTDAFRPHNDALMLAQELGDEDTAELLTKIIKMEEVHIDWAEIQREQIELTGLENYLITQTESMVN